MLLCNGEQEPESAGQKLFCIWTAGAVVNACPPPPVKCPSQLTETRRDVCWAPPPRRPNSVICLPDVHSDIINNILLILLLLLLLLLFIVALRFFFLVCRAVIYLICMLVSVAIVHGNTAIILYYRILLNAIGFELTLYSVYLLLAVVEWSWAELGVYVNSKRTYIFSWWRFAFRKCCWYAGIIKLASQNFYWISSMELKVHLQLILLAPHTEGQVCTLEMSFPPVSAYYIQCKHLSRIQMSVI